MSATKGASKTPTTKAPVARRKPVKAAPVVADAISVPLAVEPPPVVFEAPVEIPEVILPPPVIDEPIVTVAAEIIPPAAIPEPVLEAPVSVVTTTSASPPSSIFQQKVKFMATLPTPPFKGYEEFAAFGKANMEAFVKANSILAKGVEEFSKEIVSLAQASMESATTAAKAVFAAKTLKDVVALQSDFSKSSFDKFISNSSKLSELGVKVASDAIAPVAARVNVAVEKVLKPAA